MRLRVGPLSLVVLVCTITAFAVYNWLPPTGKALAPKLLSGLSVQEAALDFGDAWEVDSFSHQIPITNNRPATAVIKSFGGSCTCSMIEPREITIPPGETRTIRVTLNLTQGSGGPAQKLERRFAAAIWADLEPTPGYSSRETWQLKGAVRSPFRAPVSIESGPVSNLINTPAQKTVRLVTHNGTVQLTAASTSAHFSVQLQRTTADEREYDLTITPTAKLATGPYSGLVHISGSLSDGTVLRGATVPVSFAVTPDVMANSAELDLGCRDVGVEVTEELELRSLTDRLFTVHRIEYEGCVVAVIDRCNGKGYAIQMRVTSVGKQTGRIKFVVQPEAGGIIEVVVPVRAHGFSTK